MTLEDSGAYTVDIVLRDDTGSLTGHEIRSAIVQVYPEARMTLFEAKLESVYRQNQALVVENAKLAKQLEDVATASFVTFHANLWRDVHLQHGDSLLFIAGLDNSHGAYDSALGQFTAPINGTYFFIVSCAAQKGAGHEAGIMLTADDDIICYEDGSHEGVMSVCHVAVHLLEGQRVVAKSNGEGYFKGLGSAFTGFLISADPV
nr:hypothetical protein BaRGS_003864 [Batillaria attramentaria]